MDALSQEKKRMVRAGRLHWLHWLVLAASLVLTVFAWAFSKNQVEQKISQRFNNEADQTVELVKERLRKYEDGLWSGVAAIRANGGDISRGKWRTFADSLRIQEKYPGINGIGVIHYVAPGRLDSYLAAQRRDLPDYRIHPPHDRNEYWPITYIEPVSLNARAVGLDMAHETNRYTAARKARDTGTAQITGPIVLVQDSERTPGFLFFAPFYRNGVHDTLEARRENFAGLVYAPFVVRKLMQGTLEKTRRHIGIQILEGPNVLYDEHHSGERNFDPDPSFTRKVDVELYGRTWTFNLWSGRSFRAASASDQPNIILATGIVIDTLLLLMFLSLSRANRRAVAFTNKMTRGYREKSNELEKLFDDQKSLHEELEIRNRRLEQASNAKSDFLATMSHEIRTPMGGVIGMSDLLLRSDLDSDQRKQALMIRSSADSLLTIINDILDLSKLDSGKLRIDCTDFSLPDLIKSVSDLLGGKADEKGIKLLCNMSNDVPDAIHADENRIRQILINLVGNALKFTNHGEVRVSVRREGGTTAKPLLRFAVSDTGIGIAAEDQHRLFDRFEQVDASTSRQFGGTGLGLSISRQLARLMGGEIGVESKIGRGSTFWFTLPVEPAKATSLSDSSYAADADFEANRSLRILAAEDNRINQLILSAMITRLGHSLKVVENGESVLKAAIEDDFDVILMDVRMPGMDGPDATRAIRCIPGEQGQVPIIAVTADATPDHTAGYLAAGMSCVTTKPINQGSLLAAIDTALGETIQRPTGAEDIPVTSQNDGPTPNSRASA